MSRISNQDYNELIHTSAGLGGVATLMEAPIKTHSVLLNDQFRLGGQQQCFNITRGVGASDEILLTVRQ